MVYLSAAWSRIQRSLFPFPEEELGQHLCSQARV